MLKRKLAPDITDDTSYFTVNLNTVGQDPECMCIMFTGKPQGVQTSRLRHKSQQGGTGRRKTVALY